VHEWYLAVYADAYEWVEAPNVIGMSQFADGGIVGSKPYVSGGNYIRKMSDYCKGCAYDVGEKAGRFGLPVQLSLLGLPASPPGPVRQEPPHGADVPQLGAHVRRTPRGRAEERRRHSLQS
jgi:hypothetical protein